MNDQDNAMLQSVIAAFTESISLLAIHIEQQCEGNFQRRQFATVLKDAARTKSASSASGQTQAAILERIAEQVAGR